jgi:hypothetical protein
MVKSSLQPRAVQRQSPSGVDGERIACGVAKAFTRREHLQPERSVLHRPQRPELFDQPTDADPKIKYPNATELPAGTLPPTSANGNFIIGPTHKAAPEAVVQNVPKGKIYTFTMTSEQSKIYNPGFVRDETVFDGAVNTATTMPGDPSNVLIPTSYPGTWTRTISVYVPAQLKGRQKAPLLVVGDGGLFDTTIFTVLDNLIHGQDIAPLIAVTIRLAAGTRRAANVLRYDPSTASMQVRRT